MPPEHAIAAAGNNAAIYRLNSADRQVGKDADVLLIDACFGGSQADVLSALHNGDVPPVATVVSDDSPRFVDSNRVTPASIHHCA